MISVHRENFTPELQKSNVFVWVTMIEKLEHFCLDSKSNV